MNTMTSVLPFMGQVLILGAWITVSMGRFVRDRRQRIGIVAALLAPLLLYPVAGLPIAQWLRSVVGDLSILTLVIFSNILAQRLFDLKLLDIASRKTLLQGVALVGVAFYPLALGVSAYDPYQFGYSPILMSVPLVLASVIAWIKFKRDLAIILLLPILAYNLQLFESANLWDYVMDPILWMYALVQCMVNSKLLRFKKFGTG